MCNRTFYDDFRELKLGAVEELQKHLDEIYGQLPQLTGLVEQHPISGLHKITDATDANEGGSSCTPISKGSNQGRRKEPHVISSKGKEPVGRNTQTDKQSDLEHRKLPYSRPPHGQSSTQQQSSETGEELWMIPCFRIKLHGAKAVHIDVSEGKCDADLFKSIRDQYFDIRSWYRRFFELCEVAEIKVVKVRIFKRINYPRLSMLRRE